MFIVMVAFTAKAAPYPPPATITSEILELSQAIKTKGLSVQVMQELSSQTDQNSYVLQSISALRTFGMDADALDIARLIPTLPKNIQSRLHEIYVGKPLRVSTYSEQVSAIPEPSSLISLNDQVQRGTFDFNKVAGAVYFRLLTLDRYTQYKKFVPVDAYQLIQANLKAIHDLLTVLESQNESLNATTSMKDLFHAQWVGQSQLLIAALRPRLIQISPRHWIRGVHAALKRLSKSPSLPQQTAATIRQIIAISDGDHLDQVLTPLAQRIANVSDSLTDDQVAKALEVHIQKTNTAVANLIGKIKPIILNEDSTQAALHYKALSNMADNLLFHAYPFLTDHEKHELELSVPALNALADFSNGDMSKDELDSELLAVRMHWSIEEDERLRSRVPPTAPKGDIISKQWPNKNPLGFPKYIYSESGDLTVYIHPGTSREAVMEVLETLHLKEYTDIDYLDYVFNTIELGYSSGEITFKLRTGDALAAAFVERLLSTSQIVNHVGLSEKAAKVVNANAGVQIHLEIASHLGVVATKKRFVQIRFDGDLSEEECAHILRSINFAKESAEGGIPDADGYVFRWSFDPASTIKTLTKIARLSRNAKVTSIEVDNETAEMIRKQVSTTSPMP